MSHNDYDASLFRLDISIQGGMLAISVIGALIWVSRFENCSGPTEIRTRIAGFKVQSANHYTIGPDVLEVI